jgi:hypothetical protein
LKVGDGGQVPSSETNTATKREWRQLGFFYDRDDHAKKWRIVGSGSGVKNFSRLLREYVAKPKHVQLSEHDHYGPYMYLKVMTWTEPRLDSHAIAGRIQDLARLADLLDAKAAVTPEGARFVVGPEFAPNCEYVLEVEIKEEGFDPSSADLHCQDPS